MDKPKKQVLETTVYTNINGNMVAVGLEYIKTAYIVEGLSVEEVANKYGLQVAQVQNLVTVEKLDLIRAAHIKHGLSLLQNVQLGQAQKLMDLELQFKKMRLIQLEKTLEDYLAYFSKYNHFYKVHPINGEILRDTNNIPIQIKIPNVSKEIAELKESVALSEGLKQMLRHIDDIINKPRTVETVNSDIVDVTAFTDLFKQKSESDT